ncbi:MAG TPA: acyltransferase [Fibrobacteria bacterium]|nr:acyltransferase [Fibrobacteria bacterium]
MRLHNATALRLLGAWMVLVNHSPSLLGLPNWNGGLWGHWGLAIFFSLSGYMVSLSARRSHGPLDFLVRRARRLGPAYVAVAVGVALVVWPAFSHPAIHSFHFTGLRDLASAFSDGLRWNIPGLFQANAFHSANGSTWSLPYEVLMYGFLGLLWFCWLRRTRLPPSLVPATLWGVSTLALLCSAWILPDGDVKFCGFRIFYVVEFLALFSGGWTLAVFPLPPSRLRLFLVAVVLLRLSAFAFPTQSYALDAILFPLAVVTIGRIPVFSGRSLPDWSYGFYLWAWPVQQCLVDRFPHLTPVALSAWATAATIPIAALSWTFVERPFLHRPPRAELSWKPGLGER